jgi:uncharacterized protein
MGEVTWWTAGDGGIHVSVRVTTGGRVSEVIDSTGDRLRIRVAAPAVEGKANAEVVRFLGDLFGVRKSAVRLVRGDKAREKTLWIEGVGGPPIGL